MVKRVEYLNMRQSDMTELADTLFRCALDAWGCVVGVTGDCCVVFVQRRGGDVWIVTRSAGRLGATGELADLIPNRS